jgi:hypothetical protein
MQLTDNDLSTLMLSDLPADFFIPDDDYDAATGDGGNPKPGHDIQERETKGGDTATTKKDVEPLLSASALRAINDQVSRAIATALQAVNK